MCRKSYFGSLCHVGYIFLTLGVLGPPGILIPCPQTNHHFQSGRRLARSALPLCWNWAARRQARSTQLIQPPLRGRLGMAWEGLSSFLRTAESRKLRRGNPWLRLLLLFWILLQGLEVLVRILADSGSNAARKARFYCTEPWARQAEFWPIICLGHLKTVWGYGVGLEGFALRGSSFSIILLHVACDNDSSLAAH